MKESRSFPFLRTNHSGLNVEITKEDGVSGGEETGWRVGVAFVLYRWRGSFPDR
jgi:hypothetical protein